MRVYLKPILSNFQKIQLLIVVNVARTKPNPNPDSTPTLYQKEP